MNDEPPGSHPLNAPETNRCARCGALISPDSANSACPACLLSGALELEGGETRTLLEPRRKSPAAAEFAQYPSQLGGYRLLGLLGRGGMGSVYEAEQIANGRRVALKLLGQHLDSPEMRQRFLREGRLAAGVNHPNSLYVFGAEEIEGLPVITMEIAGGGTLKEKLKKRGPLPIAEAVDAILDVIAGLEAAFSAGVLHRDVKPSNCFVGPDGSVKVGDFGLSVSTLAKSDSFVTATGMILGTPAYAPPEQLRGDELDVRADIYSVGATLYTLLTGRAPFEGENAIQVVANAVNQKPKSLTECRPEAPPDLARVVARCLAKEPDQRYASYSDLRNALLPFSSREPESASLKIRAPAGWIDFLLAFLAPYVVLMLLSSAEEFHFGPFVDRTFYSARYYLAFLAFGFLYFGFAEGFLGAGVGKRRTGLRLVRTNGRKPGFLRALARIMIILFSIEGVRFPLIMATMSPADFENMTGSRAFYFIAVANVCPWLAVLLTLTARRENGFATVWDLLTGTRVVVAPKGAIRPSLTETPKLEVPGEGVESLGPYQVVRHLIPGQWIIATDPVLRRSVWLMRRVRSELSWARRHLGRPGRLRWLQEVAAGDVTWDAFEAPQGAPFGRLVRDNARVPWTTLRHWLHDLASELWAAKEDKTLPPVLSLDRVWITPQGQAILLEAPWPEVEAPAEDISVEDLAGQQRFLHALAQCVDATNIPLHARPVLQNLREGRFEKLSFLAGNLRGVLDKPAEISRARRAGAIFMLPVYTSIMFFVGTEQGREFPQWHGFIGFAVTIGIIVLTARALFQLLELPFRSTSSHAIFGLVVVNAAGARASRFIHLRRWLTVWLPLLIPLLVGFWISQSGGDPFYLLLVSTLLFIGAAIHAAVNPQSAWHDRLSGTRVVRR